MLKRVLAWVVRPPRSLVRPLPTARMVRSVAFCVLVSLPLLLPAQAAPKQELPEVQAPIVFTQSQRPAWEDAPVEEAPVGGGDPFSIIQLRRSNLFAWPAVGMLTSYFGKGHPTGIDIGLDNDMDTPVWASADGVVSHAGGNKCCDYGLFVIVEHEHGFTSLYAHLSRLSVSTGERVTQGQQLGLGGATGDATGKHLHFEMLASGHFVDPLRYLPSKQPGFTSGEQLACGEKPLSIDAASQLTFSFGPPDSGLEVEAMTLSPAVAAAPKVQLQGEGAQAVSLAVPPVVAATTRTYAYELALTLKLGEERRDVSCAMALTTMPTLANPPEQIPMHAARSNAIQALKVQQAQQAQQKYQQELWQYQQTLAAAQPEPEPTPDLTALLFQAQTILQAANSGSPIGAPPLVAPPPQTPALVPPPPPIVPTAPVTAVPATATPTRTPTPAASPTPVVSATPAAAIPTRTPSPAASATPAVNVTPAAATSTPAPSATPTPVGAPGQ